MSGWDSYPASALGVYSVRLYSETGSDKQCARIYELTESSRDGYAPYYMISLNHRVEALLMVYCNASGNVNEWFALPRWIIMA